MWFSSAAANTRAIKVLLEAAERHAQELGDAVPGPEHLLLAALDLDDDSARASLAAHGATPDALRGAITRSHADALGATDLPEARAVTTRGAVYRSSGPLQEAFRRAAQLSKKGRDRRFRGAHVVIAVAELERGTSARVLESLGISRDGLITTARSTLAG